VERPTEGTEQVFANQRDPRKVTAKKAVRILGVDKVTFFQTTVDTSGCGHIVVTTHRAARDRGWRLTAVHKVVLVAQVGVELFQRLFWVDGAIHWRAGRSTTTLAQLCVVDVVVGTRVDLGGGIGGFAQMVLGANERVWNSIL
jgi:hypothetical protein